MGKKIFTVLIILTVAAFVYYNKGSMVEKYRTRKKLENRIEELTGTDVDLKNLFKGVEGISRSAEGLGDENLDEIKDRLETLTQEERESLSRLLDEKGDDLESFLNEVVKDVTKGDNP